MGDRADLLALKARVDAATGPDREIDGDLVLAFYGYPDRAPPSAKRYYKWTHEDGAKVWKSHGSDFAAYNIIWDAPAYTASVDAALALIERVLPGWRWSASSNVDGSVFAYVFRRDPRRAPGDQHVDFRANSPTPALALLAALLRAKIAEIENDRS